MPPLLWTALLCCLALAPAPDPADADEAVVKEAGLQTDGPALLDFFRKLTLGETDRARVLALIRDLGDDDFAVRQKASAGLLELGPVAQPLLREALRDDDPEVASRAEKCLRQTEKAFNGTVAAACARLLARRKPEAAAEVLLGFLPYASDEAVADEVRAALAALALRGGKPDGTLLQALTDKVVARRAAAAEALARGAPGERPALRRLLRDPEPLVRRQVALALAEAKEKEAVPVLIALLAELPAGQGWRVEEALGRLAGDGAPAVSLGADEASRRACRDAWDAWWKKNADKVDLAKLTEAPRLLGYTLVVELNRGINGRLTELGADGKPRWSLEGLQYPVDAQVVGPDRVLVAEYVGRKVSERDLTGKVLWEKALADSPTGVQRLANGNTFITCRSSLVELDRDGKEVLTRRCHAGAITAAQKLRDGEVAFLTRDGIFHRLDASGKEVKSFPVGGPLFTFSSIDVLPGGRVLVPLYGHNKVVEYDGDGKAVWEAAVQQPTGVLRLPGGHTLVSSALTQRVVELDRTGAEVWQYRGGVRLLRARRR
jgi:HEAT repeat protein